MFMFNVNSNRRFTGTLTIEVGACAVIIEASDFSLEEARTRSLGDGDQQYEELWIGHPNPDSVVDEHDCDGDNEMPFEAVHVNVVRFNDDFYEFHGNPKVINPVASTVCVQDELELYAPQEQGLQADD